MRGLAGLLGALVLLVAAASAPATTAPKTIWVGTVHLTYLRHYAPTSPIGPALERDSRSLTITNKRDGTATATALVRSTTEYPCSNGTTSGRKESWAFGGRVAPVRVSFIGTSNRYQVTHPNPSKVVPIEERDCVELKVRTVTAYAMDVGFQLYGRAPRGATRLTGEWKHPTTCAGTCVSHGWSGRWDLRLVEVGAAGEGDRGRRSGDGGGGTGSGKAGAGCDARTRPGTAGDDVLRGTAAAELLRGLAGNDRISGLAGGDCLYGGPGDDVAQGGLGRDLVVGDAGADVLDGGPGDDELRARDGAADTVRCGAGARDVAVADPVDRVSGCETVRR